MSAADMWAEMYEAELYGSDVPRPIAGPAVVSGKEARRRAELDAERVWRAATEKRDRTAAK